MPNPMNRPGYPNQFEREIRDMFIDKYTALGSEFDKIAMIDDFGTGKTLTKAEISPLGQLRAMGEGDAISFDVPEEGHKKSLSTVKFGLGFQHTDEMSSDELFAMTKKLVASLARSAAYCRETNFWALFNLGFTTTLGWDGLSVFNDAHTTLKSGDTIDNLGAADLTDTSLKAAFDYFDSLVDEAGMKVLVKPTTLLVAPDNKYMAHDLLKATGRVWDGLTAYGHTTDGTTKVGVANAEKHFANGLNPSFNLVPEWNYFISHFLTDDDAWFLLSDQHDFEFLWKKKPTMSKSDDFATDNTMYKVVMRFATGVFDYKGAYGSPGA